MDIPRKSLSRMSPPHPSPKGLQASKHPALLIIEQTIELKDRGLEFFWGQLERCGVYRRGNAWALRRARI